MAQRNRRAPLLSELYKLGLPTIEFCKTGAPSMAHTSGHAAIDHQYMHEFNCLDEFGSDSEFEDSFGCASMILGLSCIRTFRKVTFNNESTIQTAVSLFLEDIISLLDLVGKVQILPECSVSNEKGAQYRLADFWTVYLGSKPLLVVVVKTPTHGVAADDDGEIKLNDLNVLGQMYDYLRNVQDSFGPTHVFGIVTTLKHWKFVWFSSSDELAVATHVSVTDPLSADTADLAGTTRDVSASRIYKQDEEALPRLVMSLVRKAQSTTFQPVSLLTTRRMYVNVLPKAWQWLRPTEAIFNAWADRLTLHVVSKPSAKAEYIVLKSLHRGSSCKVWFAMIRNTEQCAS